MSNFVRGVISNTVGIGILFGTSYPLEGDLYWYAVISLGIQWGVFLLHGLPFHSEKFYDASGSLTHLALVMSSLLWGGHCHPRALVASIMCVIWMTRLGSYLFARILRDGKDGRFDELKVNPIRFLGVWTIQAVWVYLLELPVIVLNNRADQPAIGVLDGVGWALWIIGFMLELISDTQKNAFRSKAENRNKFITTGLWAYSRHPNYAGEILLWIGVCLSGSAAFVKLDFLAWLCVFVTCFLLLRVSGIPLLEAAGQKKWGDVPEYQHYVKNTSVLFLWKPAPPFEDIPVNKVPLAGASS